MQESGFSLIIKRITNSLMTVPEFRFFGKIILGIIGLGIAFLILKSLV